MLIGAGTGDERTITTLEMSSDTENNLKNRKGGLVCTSGLSSIFNYLTPIVYNLLPGVPRGSILFSFYTSLFQKSATHCELVDLLF